MQRLLAIETATDACSLALRTESGIVARHHVEARAHTAIIFSLLDELLDEAGMKRSGIDALVYGHGPGSFTGVRIAATVAQGIALPRALPVRGISTLATLAAGGRREGHRGPVLVMLDARRGEVYYAGFEATDQGLERLFADALSSPADVVVPSAGNWLAVGNARDVHAERLPTNIANLPWAAVQHPEARDLLTLAQTAGEPDAPGSALTASPVYLRGAVD